MSKITNIWSESEDVSLIACGVLRISAPEMADRFLQGRTPEAINMRMTYLRKGDYGDRGSRKMEDLAVLPLDTSKSMEAVGSQNLLIAILRWASRNGSAPPGLTAQRTRELCKRFGIEIPGEGLKLGIAG